MPRLLRARDAVALLALIFMLNVASQPAQAQTDLRQVGKQLKTNYDEAVVLVKVILSSTGDGSGDRTIPGESCGTVIAPDGLVAVPLFVIDPTQLAKRMAGPMGDALPLNTQVKEIKLTFGKRPEVPATVVLRDSDLNLALLRPLKKLETPVKFIDLAKAETEVEALTPVITMTRLGNVGGREVALLPGTIQATVSKPRKFFVPAGSFAGFGLPAFTGEGKLLGITMLQISLGGLNDLQSGIFSLNMSHMGILPIILPAAQLKELADQAPQKAEPLKAPAETPAPAKKKDGEKTAPATKPAAGKTE